jgi:hypothetical protein
MNVRLEIRTTESEACLLNMSAGPGVRTESVMIAPLGQLAKVNGAARNSLKSIARWGALGLETSAERQARLLTDLAAVGASASLGMLGSGSAASGGARDRMTAFFQKVLADRRHDVPELWFSSPVDLPLELMLVSPRLPDTTRPNRRHLETEARRSFLGLQFTIRRALPDEKSLPGRFLRRDTSTDRVDVAPYSHKDFRAFVEQGRALDSGDTFHVRPRQPDVAMARSANGGQRIASLLIRGSQPREEIVHVVAHGLEDESGGYEAGFLFGGEGILRNNELPVRLRHFDSELWGFTVPDPADGPLALLSSCSAANVDYHWPTSIPDQLRNAGYRAVIASLVGINIPTAVDFSSNFFEYLRRDASVGQALVRARRSLLERHGNLAGLTYVGYGETRLVVAPRTAAI